MSRKGHLYRKGNNDPRPSFPCQCGDHVFAQTARPGVAMVSPEDRPILDSVGWFISNEGYVTSTLGPLHRRVMSNPVGRVVDHRNHDKQDNRRPNLRSANNNQSVFNKRKMKTRAAVSSRFKGVNFQHGKWAARIVAYGVRENLGTFNCDTAAALAYDRAARRLHGEFAKLNFAGGVS